MGGSKTLGSKVIPLFGDAAFIAYDLAEKDYQNQLKEIDSKMIEALNQTGGVAEHFALETNNVNAQNAPRSQIIISRGKFTQMYIDNYNTWVEYKLSHPDTTEDMKAQIQSLGVEGVITLNDILTNPLSIESIWNGGPMSDIEKQDVFGVEYIEILIDRNGKPVLIPLDE